MGSIQPNVWQNEHQVFTQNYQGMIELFNDHPGDASQSLADYNAQTRKIQANLASILQGGSQARARALGNGWSFSKVAATTGNMLDTYQLKAWFNVADGYVAPHSRFKGKPGYLYHFQCGMELFDITAALYGQGKSLPVSGSSCNQTVVGAFSTSTHGAAYQGGGALPNLPGNPPPPNGAADWGGGALHDYVRALHIIVGPDRHVWLQRASDPAVTIDYAGLFGITAQNFLVDDTLFDAALVSFGSFGVIHGVLLEATDLFVLDATRYSTALPALQDAFTSFDFSNVNLYPPASGPAGSLYHFEVLNNPFDPQKGAAVLVMHKVPYPNNFTTNIPVTNGDPWDDIASLAAALTNLVPPADTLAANLVFTNGYTPFTHWLGTLAQQNPKLGHIAPGSVVLSMAIPQAQAWQAFQICEQQRVQQNCFAWYDIRFVPKAKGLLAFQRFPETCVLEMVGPGTGSLIKMFNSVLFQLRAANIDFAFHWGKYQAIDASQTRYGCNGTFDYQLNPGELERIYGNNVSIWKAQRARLFNNDQTLMDLFSNDLMVGLGLA
jgi:hypothetical protein